MTFHCRNGERLFCNRRQYASKLNEFKCGYVLFRKGFSSNSNSVEMSFSKYDEFSSESKMKESPLVIMHGLFGSKSNWHSMCISLNKSTERTVYSVDARNHGNSPHTDDFSYDLIANDIQRFAMTISNPIYFIGHSMGGRAGMYFSLKYPATLDKLIIVDISPVSSGSDFRGMLGLFKIMRDVKIDKSVPKSKARKLVQEQMLEKIHSKMLVNFLLTNFTVTEDGTYKWRLNLDSLEKHYRNGALEFPKVSQTFEKPTLFIAGAQGNYLNEEDEEEILKIFPQSKFVYLDAGHWLHFEDPVNFRTAVTDFLNE